MTGRYHDRVKGTARFSIPMINRRFLEWIDGRLGILATGVSLKKAASELASNNRESGFSPNAKGAVPRRVHHLDSDASILRGPA